MEYVLKSTAIIGIFYICYKFLLQQETFFQNNRKFLVTGIIASILLPLIIIPIYVNAASENLFYTFSEGVQNNSVHIIDTAPLFNLEKVFILLYALGVTSFGIRLLVQLYSLASLIFRNEKFRSGTYIFVKVGDNISPFSFFNWIVYNPNQFSSQELEQIITHEKVHVKQNHSIDILLVQIASVIFWCNPLIWLYKKELEHNLEFIADHEALKQSECEKSYQHLLLKTSMPNYQMALTNNFYNSLIKKRIIMLHKSKSKQLNVWKYGLILPALALFLMSFNTETVYLADASESFNPTVNAIEKPEVNTNENYFESDGKEIVIITKYFSDEDLDNVKTELKRQGITIKFKGIKRNKSGEITAIKIEAKSEKSSVNYNTSSDDAIQPIKLAFHSDGSSMSIGNTKALHGKDYYFSTKDGNTKIRSTGKNNHVYVYSNKEKHEHEEAEEHEHEEYEEHEHEESEEHEHEVEHEGTFVFEVHSDDDDDDDEKVYLIRKSKDGKKVKEIIINGEGNTWHSDGDEKKIEIIRTVKGNHFISSDDHGKNSLIFLNGKEISYEKFKAMDQDTIETIEVLDGKDVIKKYGEKAKNGVMLINTK